MTVLPNPGVITTFTDTVSELTEERSEITAGPFFYRDLEVNGDYLTWTDGESVRYVEIVSQPRRDGLSFVVQAVGGVLYEIRAVDPYDAVVLSPGAGVPQPVEAIRASLLGGGQLATELDAVVARDNGVVTLMLDTASGIYLRFGHSWQLLGPDSTALEDTSLVAVGPTALDVWDAADATNTPITIGDLPIVTGRTGKLNIIDPSIDTEKIPVDKNITASGVSIPDIDDRDDLPVAVQFAREHPEARWFVDKRAAALGANPPEWEQV